MPVLESVHCEPRLTKAMAAESSGTQSIQQDLGSGRGHATAANRYRSSFRQHGQTGSQSGAAKVRLARKFSFSSLSIRQVRKMKSTGYGVSPGYLVGKMQRLKVVKPCDVRNDVLELD